MIKPFTMQISTPETKVESPKTSSPVGMNFSGLQNVKSTIISTEEEDTKKKRSSKKKDRATLFSSPAHMGEVVTDTISDNGSDKRPLSLMESNEPIENKYAETNAILRSAIAQIDAGLMDIQQDIAEVRAAKTLRNKYNHLSLLQSNMGTYISNKISAARELNSTIGKCNDFELKRFKEMKASAAADQDDDQKLMEMYKAFVNVPADNAGYNGMGVMGPSMSSMTLPSPQLMGSGIGSVDVQYQDYLQNLTPSQNMMILESNPDIKQVVIYNQETGARYFEVMNMATGEVVPNAEKHDAMFMEDVTIDQKNGVARNINIGETYPLVVVGQPIINEY